MSILLFVLLFELIKMFIVMFISYGLFNMTGCTQGLFIFPLTYVIWKILNIILNQFITIKIQRGE